MMEQPNTLYSTPPSMFDKTYKNDDVYMNYVLQNSLQLTPLNDQPTRVPLSEYNQQQKFDNNLTTAQR